MMDLFLSNSGLPKCTHFCFQYSSMLINMVVVFYDMLVLFDTLHYF
jgi:hypothetical protein